MKEYKHLGRHTLSFMLREDKNVRHPETSSGSIINFHSKEAPGNNQPRLSVTEKDIPSLLLTDIRINGKSIGGFSPEVFHYPIPIETGWTDIPEITYEKSGEQSTITVIKATCFNGTPEERTTTIRVVNDEYELTYTILFVREEVTANAFLKNILMDGKEIEFFEQDKFFYTCYFPYTYNNSPEISWVPENRKQTVAYEPVTDIFSNGENRRTAILKVISGDGSTTVEYRILCQVLPALDLFLCIGQSNMAGRGYMDADKGDLDPIAGCYLFTPSFGFEEATNPMNQYSNIRKTLGEQQISPAYGFARYISENVPAATVGMVVNAKGGTSMDEWSKGAELYNKTVNRMKEALPWGELKAILWHQGESNTKTTGTYLDKLNKMVTDMRTEFNSPDPYFLAGELIYTWQESADFNKMIQTVQDNIDNSDWVSAGGLRPRASGDVHFDRESNIILGERYAKKVIEKIYSPSSFQETQEEQSISFTEAEGVIRISGVLYPATLTVYHVSGKKIDEQLLSGDHVFTLPGKGMYILSVRDNNKMYKEKFLMR
ncbi:MAG: sialate O-acetylesterase [Candidatus Azobacteroides sp.]|nr:sialate O-acetylesterase [Candidatus Azobacteroides sp.]